ncbi:hypothetical protein Tsubulata_007053 [Turnera subulata]|uniref:non-specific serine/threonine protein kinase n=1 Tax=Turnera subulata TaxID=218843 RepID=A0A9Q0GLG2_9ROSI|nr:hypothetical protein Tsubulata_007053 [Turnera subulata]
MSAPSPDSPTSPSPPTESPPQESSPPPKENASPPPENASPPPSPPKDASPPPPKEETPAQPPPQEQSNPSPPPPSSSGGSGQPPPTPSQPQPGNNGGSPPAPKSNDDNNNNNNNNGGGSNDNNNNGGGSNDNNKPWSPPSHNNNHHSPPSPRSLGPGKDSPSKGSSSKDDGDGGGGGGSNVNVAAAVGVAAGVAVLLLLLMIVFCCACKKKKKTSSKKQDQFYYADTRMNTPGPGVMGGPYYNNSPNQWNNSPNPWNNGNQVPPPPGMTPGQGPWPSPPGAMPPGAMPPGGPGQGNWPPSQGVPMSSDQSSSYSGPQGPALPPPHPNVALGFSKSSFSYEELAQATQGFSQGNLLGQGGFGYVHKGILPNGKEIAVKSLKRGSGQGDREFQAEVEIISRVHHRHLVSLVGYCIESGQKLLVYEFVENSTLEYHLHGAGRPTMDWPTRIKIALGSAKGLGYLHEDCHPRIIHRDIKAANILLDYNFEAKVADFGLAKLTSDNNTHVSTRVMGTFGYLAPEYASSGKLTEKSDVFSFGVMLLELITGRRPVDPTGRMEDSLVDWARPLCSQALEQGQYQELVDPALEGNYDPQEMACMVACAGLAVSHSARRRPKMSQIVRALEGDISLDHLHEGMKTSRSTMSLSNSSDSENTSSYTAEMNKFRKLALDSREYPTSEFGQTSEYGLNPSMSSSEMSKSGMATRRNSP